MWPRLPGSETCRGTQIHSSQYRCADDFKGKRVAIVGAGNSGAQILAEVSAPGVASSALWSTVDKPSFLPMGLSGKEIFDTGEPAERETLKTHSSFFRGRNVWSFFVLKKTGYKSVLLAECSLFEAPHVHQKKHGCVGCFSSALISYHIYLYPTPPPSVLRCLYLCWVVTPFNPMTAVARLRQKQGFVREGDIPSLHR